MELNRSVIFFSILALSIIALTMALGAMVYTDPRSDGITDGSGGESDSALPGANLGISAPGSIIGTWQDIYGDAYLFDGAQCTYNYDYSRSVPYSAHTMNVILHSGSLQAATVYVCNDDPGSGFGFIDGKLYYIVNQNNRWTVWYAMNKIDDPIVGTWNDCYNTFTSCFDGSILKVTLKQSPLPWDDVIQHEFTYHYSLSSATVGSRGPGTLVSYGRLPVYVTDRNANGVDAFCFVDGILYGCVRSDGRYPYDYYTLTINHRIG